MNRVEQLKNIQDKCREIFEKKNADYGDSFSSHGTIGVMVRIADKLTRFTNVTKNKLELKVDDETLKDTLMDLHNYAAMAIMCLEDIEPEINMV
jgi:hypothetical protein